MQQKHFSTFFFSWIMVKRLEIQKTKQKNTACTVKGKEKIQGFTFQMFFFDMNPSHKSLALWLTILFLLFLKSFFFIPWP